MHIVDLSSQILKENNRIAETNSLIFKNHNLHVTNFMSAPGAGKTSLLEVTVKMLKDKWKIAVIEGDLQTSLDADRMKQIGIESYQITTGTVCHLDARMVSNAINEFNLNNYDFLFIENVGNLVCPSDYDLGENLKVMIYSIVEGEDKPKKYPVMFHAVDAVLLNKIDLLPYSGIDLDKLMQNVVEVNPKAKIFSISCKEEEGLDAWVNWFLKQSKVK